MKRRDIFKEFLTTIFGSTTVKASGGKIYRSGDWFSTCDFGDKAFESYVSLLKIAYSNSEPQMQQPSYLPKAFPRTESIQRFFTYLESYSSKLALPDANDAYANTYAYKAAITLLSAIFKKSDNKDKFVIENEDISSEFRNALDKIHSMCIGSNINDFLNSLSQSEHFIHDKDYANIPNKENFCLYMSSSDIMPIIKPITLKIYIDPSKKYKDNGLFFLNSITAWLYSYNAKTGITTNQPSSEESYLSKPLSLIQINNDIPEHFYFATFLDDDVILNQYHSRNENELIQAISRKAAIQLLNTSGSTLTYELCLVDYTEDLIRRVLSLDLKWLYNNSKNEIEKCREEVEKILIGYPEVYTYIDGCSEEIIEKQLLTILHHAIIEITDFINNNGEDVAGYANAHNCEKHIKYIKGKVYGNSFKELTKLSEKLKAIPNKEPHSLYDRYYYTSSNELYDLLNSISSYKNYFKKSKNST